MAGSHARRRTAAWNLVFGYAQIALAITRNILLVPLYLLFIDIEEFGAWLATGGVLAQLFVSDFGLTAAVIQRAAAAYGRGDLEDLRRATGSGLSVATLLAGLLTVISLALAPVVPLLAGDGRSDVLLHAFVIVAFANGVGIVGLAGAGLLRGLQRPVLAGATTLLADVAGIVASIALLYADAGLYALAAGHAVRNVLLAGATVTGCLWVCRRRLGIRPAWSVTDARAMFAASYYQFFTSVALRFQSKADVFFVGLLLGPQPAALYGLTARAAETVQMLSGQVVASLDASLAHLHGSGDSVRFRQVLGVAVGLTAFVGAFGMAAVAAWNEAFVSLWVGAGLFAGQATSLLLALVGVVAVLGYVPYIVLMARGDFRDVSTAYVTSVAVHVPLLLVLTPFGMAGAALAALLASIYRTLALAGALRRGMGLAVADMLRGLRRAFSASAAPFIAAAVTLALAPVPADWPGFLAAVTVFSCATLMLSWLSNRSLWLLLSREFNLSVGALRTRR